MNNDPKRVRVGGSAFLHDAPDRIYMQAPAASRMDAFAATGYAQSMVKSFSGVELPSRNVCRVPPEVTRQKNNG